MFFTSLLTWWDFKSTPVPVVSFTSSKTNWFLVLEILILINWQDVTASFKTLFKMNIFTIQPIITSKESFRNGTIRLLENQSGTHELQTWKIRT